MCVSVLHLFCTQQQQQQQQQSSLARRCRLLSRGNQRRARAPLISSITKPNLLPHADRCWLILGENHDETRNDITEMRAARKVGKRVNKALYYALPKRQMCLCNS